MMLLITFLLLNEIAFSSTEIDVFKQLIALKGRNETACGIGECRNNRTLADLIQTYSCDAIKPLVCAMNKEIVQVYNDGGNRPEDILKYMAQLNKDDALHEETVGTAVRAISEDKRFLAKILQNCIQDPDKLETISKDSYLHPNGFDKFTIANFDGWKMRMHIWWPVEENGDDYRNFENIHSHRWIFGTSMISGEYESEIYKIPESPIPVFDRFVSHFLPSVVDLPIVKERLSCPDEPFVKATKYTFQGRCHNNVKDWKPNHQYYMPCEESSIFERGQSYAFPLHKYHRILQKRSKDAVVTFFLHSTELADENVNYIEGSRDEQVAAVSEKSFQQRETELKFQAVIDFLEGSADAVKFPTELRNRHNAQEQ